MFLSMWPSHAVVGPEWRKAQGEAGVAGAADKPQWYPRLELRAACDRMPNHAAVGVAAVGCVCRNSPGCGAARDTGPNTHPSGGRP